MYSNQEDSIQNYKQHFGIYIVKAPAYIKRINYLIITENTFGEHSLE